TSTVDFALAMHLPGTSGLHRVPTEPGDVTLGWQAPLPMGMLAQDDGTFEGFWWVAGPSTSSQFFAQHFQSPLPVGYTVNQIAVLASADAARTNFEKFLVVGSDVDGMPDMENVLWSATNIQAATYPEVRWEVEDVGAVPATTDFWVLVQWPEGNTMGPYIAADEDGMPREASFWTSDSGMTWNGVADNFMIRAFVGETPVREQVALASYTVEAAKITTRRAVGVKEDYVANSGHTEAPGLYNATRELQSYNVYRTTDPEVWGDVYANVASTLFTDMDFAFETDYWYTVTAVYDEGESGPDMPVHVFEWTPLYLSYVETFDYEDDTPFDSIGWVADDGEGTDGNWNIEDMAAHFDWSPSLDSGFVHTLTSPPADLTDATIVRLRLFQFFDDYDDTENGLFNLKISASSDGFASETVLWTHNDSVFGNIEGEFAFDVSEFAGSDNAQVRFTAWGDDSFTMDGWWIDIVMVETDMFPNEPPMAFNMLTPADGDTVDITTANLETDMLTLSWEAAVDPNGDEVTYGIMLGDGLANSIAFGDTTGTSVSIPLEAIYTVLQAAGESMVSGEWGIYATDGVDTTWAENAPFTLTIDASTVSIDNMQIPEVYALHQNYPNPFNPTTTIQYDLPEATDVTLVVYNMLGQRVATLVNGQQSAGYYTIQWRGLTDTGTPIASGIYLYRIQAGKFSKTLKMMYMK
ncbi:MAG: T9SS type A sorting domain-containing protein, partial [Lentisphaeria bacterium]|nr:T9SS type A sorting domain-containing protein [Lentisphaeria bacterium]